MARLTNPVSGTVVRCEGDLAAHFTRLGWADADAKSVPVVEPESEPEREAVKPKRGPGRPKKKSEEDE